MKFIGDLERLFATSLYPLRVPLFVGGLVVVLVFIRTARRRGWLSSARAHPGRSIAVLVPLLAVAIPLGWYLASPLFITTRIDDAPPVALTVAEPVAPSISPSAVPSAPSAGGSVSTPASSAVAPAAPAVTPAVTPDPGPARRAGTFHGNDDFHFGRGTARIVVSGKDVFVRLEDFAVRNGPDLYVYLSRDASGYAANGNNLELGRLKASEGNQNYRLPAGKDADAYRSVVIWCKQFGVQFAVAPLKGS